MAGVFFSQGKWTDENPKLTGPMDHAFWMSTVVFDGARSIRGLVPDLDLHCERLVRSTEAMLMNSPLPADEIAALCREGIRKMPRESELYVRPMVFAREGFVSPDPDSAEFVLAVYDSPMPGDGGFSACFSSFRRPARDQAPTDAKASCLYPNSQRALREATQRGFDNAILCDPNDNIAEFATANIWIAKDGVAMTPAANGTFLAGITRRRVIQLLRDDGIEVIECPLRRQDILEADEVFNSGNYGKVMPVVRVEDRDFQPGPITKRAHDLYFEFANDASVF
ncbi:branched-chain amino acid aminotransferase [Oceanibacterium hippocampi]|uniref:Probable branched-chain-amino-acid aminotransferase n=1 Tax=Oceanibacterium hippocampi TaxID=745714 RepID=A0A1Y5R8Z4_9PROT|nr:branched-chain amino acid aminotransferase [Oceanibacterium hippocampi]SLN11896.1 Branched-chain-amino-acid aminotransferase [Oceanibacterium hippocampi]